MKLRIKRIKKIFTRYGFVESPVSDVKLASWILRGFSDDEIYEFACDIYCGI